MPDQSKSSEPAISSFRLGFAVIATLAAMALTTWWTAQRVDREMRQEWLQKASMLQETLNSTHIKTLQGNETDLARPNYQRLKSQFSTARKIIPNCRFARSFSFF